MNLSSHVVVHCCALTVKHHNHLRLSVLDKFKFFSEHMQSVYRHRESTQLTVPVVQWSLENSQFTRKWYLLKFTGRNSSVPSWTGDVRPSLRTSSFCGRHFTDSFDLMVWSHCLSHWTPPGCGVSGTHVLAQFNPVWLLWQFWMSYITMYKKA